MWKEKEKGQGTPGERGGDVVHVFMKRNEGRNSFVVRVESKTNVSVTSSTTVMLPPSWLVGGNQLLGANVMVDEEMSLAAREYACGGITGSARFEVMRRL
jgi:hypothetical protein